MPSEELEKFRILESEKRYRSALRWLTDFRRANWDEVRVFVSSFCPPGDEFLSRLAEIRDWEKDGLKPSEVDTLEDDLRLGMAWYRQSLDNLSIIGSTIPPLDKGDAMPWALPKDEFFLSPFEGDGGYLTITGNPRAGKTGIACLYAEMWMRAFPEAEVLTNVPLVREVKGIRKVTGMLELLSAIADALEADRRWLWVFDEGGLAWLRSQAMRSSSIGLEKFARIVPKLGGSFIFIEQREEGIPSVITDFSQAHILCTSAGFVIADLPHLRGGLRDVPRPAIAKYRSGEVGYFEMDINMDSFLKALPERGKKTQEERIRAFVAKELTLKEQPRSEKSGRFQPKAPPGAESSKELALSAERP